MSNRFKLVIIAFCYLIFSSFINNVQASENCKLYIGDITKYANSNNVVANIYMENANNQITTLGLNIEYDISKLKFISSKAGNDLRATVKLAENMPEKGKVSIAALALNGFKNDGLYYTVIFQVLDDSFDIPINLSKREITDKDGKDINVGLQGTTIKISKETTVIEKSPENQKIERFEIIEETEYDNLDTYIQEKGQIKVLGNDILVYEIENDEIVEIQDDGTIIPVRDGTTNVRVKLNNETIGNVVIEVENKEIKSISATEEAKEFQAMSTSQDVQLIENNIEEEHKLAETINIEKEKKITNKYGGDKMNIKLKILIILFFSIVIYLIFTTRVFATDAPQKALWFMKDLNITQVPNGDTSHKNTQNFDVVGITSNDIFAPFDCKIVAIYPAVNSGNTVVIQSLNKVYYADGTLDIMSIAFAHDNDISDCYVGKELKQGEIFYQNGDYGLAWGIHTHVSCMRGEYMDKDGNYVNNVWAETRSSFVYEGKTYTVSSPHNDISPTSALFITENTNIYETMGLQFEKYSFELTANIHPYTPSTLTWNAIDGASYYRIRGKLNGVDYNFENPDFRKNDDWSSEKWTTEKTTYTRTLAAGDYSLYVQAFNSNDEVIKTSNEISVSIKDAEIQFEDPKFKEYIKNYIINRNDYSYTSKMLEDESIITFNDLPRTLALTYCKGAYNNYKFPDDCNCAIYINEAGNENHEIHKYEHICNDYSTYGESSFKAEWFKSLDGMTSVKTVNLDGYYNNYMFDDLGEFLRIFSKS